ncbi:uncharacterized protein LOC106666376 [Cimex lectularius]|uniref:Uncharacterized protein n=1 Tax=Cimex lectularius TaxID=79782 RepID=A0A8I6RPE2_CIMLE|nr:uncharacterized protein LOC106666376 [Cimex lectularius]
MPSKFCNSTNQERCLELLAQELNVLDYNYVLKPKENLTVNLINLSYDLLNDLKKLKVKFSKLTEDNLRLGRLYDGAVQEKTKFEKLSAKESESVCNLQDRVKTLTLQKESAEKELNKSKTEVNRLLKSSNVQKLQHEHDLRRKEQLIDRLKSQLEVYLDNDDLEKAPAAHAKLDPGPTHPSKEDLELFIKTLQNNLQFTNQLARKERVSSAHVFGRFPTLSITRTTERNGEKF